MSMQRRKVWVHGQQQGFTLIEILIALLIGVFLLAALLTIVQANRRVYGDQSQLAQLQDNERMAMTLMTDVIEMAGYFPSPHTEQLERAPRHRSVRGRDSRFWQLHHGGPRGQHLDTLCDGAQRRHSELQWAVEYQSSPPSVAREYPVCQHLFNRGRSVGLHAEQQRGGHPRPVQPGQRRHQCHYDLGHHPFEHFLRRKDEWTTAGKAVDTYFNAAQLNSKTPSLWDNVISVLIQLTFTNPLFTNATSTSTDDD